MEILYFQTLIKFLLNVRIINKPALFHILLLAPTLQQANIWTDDAYMYYSTTMM